MIRSKPGIHDKGEYMPELLNKDDLNEISTERRYGYIDLPHPSGQGECTIRIRNIYASEYERQRAASKADEERDKAFGSLIVAWCWVDKDGKRVLEDKDVMNPKWGKYHPGFIYGAIAAVHKFSGLDTETPAIRDALKNSIPDAGEPSNELQQDSDE